MQDLFLNGNTEINSPGLFLQHQIYTWDQDHKQLVFTKAYAQTGIHLQQDRIIDQQQAAFNFCLNGSQQFKLTGNYLPARGNADDHHTLILPAEKLTIESESYFEIQSLTVSLPMDSFRQIMQDYLHHLPGNYVKCIEQPKLCYFKNHPWSPQLLSSIKQIMLPANSLSTMPLYLESKMLEILALVFDSLNNPGIETPVAEKIKKRHAEKMLEAKEFLQKNIVNPPSLQQLAKQVGTNVFTLKKEFKNSFGLPVYHWISKQKMELAAKLLLDTSMHVNEIALAIGFENHSAFTRAFKQHYQILPSEYKTYSFPAHRNSLTGYT